MRSRFRLRRYRRCRPDCFHPLRTGATPANREERRGLHVGGIGLGAGTIAAFGRPQDTFRFYEISPSVVEVNRQYFHFLSESPARSRVILGDARISLEQEANRNQKQGFDVLAVDAFTGGFVPVHLLTREAFDLYFQHLQPDGVLALHISSQYFDFVPVVQALGDSFGKEMVLVTNDHVEEENVWDSDWILLTANQEFLSRVTEQTRPLPEGRKPILWTDDYSNLLGILW